MVLVFIDRYEAFYTVDHEIGHYYCVQQRNSHGLNHTFIEENSVGLMMSIQEIKVGMLVCAKAYLFAHVS